MGGLCESMFTRGEVVRTCPACGQLFKAKNPKHTYCSLGCRRKATGRRIGRVGMRDACQECGRSYVVRHPNQKYCCKKCSNRARGHRYYWERGGREKQREYQRTPRGLMLDRMNHRKRREIARARERGCEDGR